MVVKNPANKVGRRFLNYLLMKLLKLQNQVAPKTETIQNTETKQEAYVVSSLTVILFLKKTLTL